MNSPKVIEYQHGDDLIKVTVYAANGIRGTRRNRVRSEILESINEIKSTIDKDEFILMVIDYPDCIGAGDVEINGVKTVPDYATFRDWPDALTGQWTQAAGELNPHWLDPDAGKKKATA